MVRTGLLGAGAAAGLVAPAAAAQPPQSLRSPLQVVGPWEIGGLAPARSGYIFTRMQIAETLLGAHDDGTPEPALAQRWSSSADGLMWRFELRPSARFHDGTPVTAQAVARCLRAARVAPALLSVAPIESIDADGASSVVVRLSERFASLAALLAHSSTLILSPASYAADGSVHAIVASGPYRIASLEPPQRLEAVAFEGFDGPKPAIERVRYLSAGRAETRALMAAAGQADLAYSLDPASAQRLRARRSVHLETVMLPRTAIIKINAGLPALRDVRVRRALSLATDRAGIAKALLRDPELAATQLFAPVLAGWHDSTLAALGYDPAAAMRLLAELGWRRTADGLRDASGQPIKFVLHTFPDRPELPLIATALQEQWRQIGITVQVNVGNSGDIPLGHRNGSLQLGLAARNYASVPDPVGTLVQDFGRKGGDWGAMGWSSDTLSAALAELVQGHASAAQVAKLRARVTGILQAELPVIPIAWYREQVAVSTRIVGVNPDPLERSYRLTQMAWQA